MKQLIFGSMCESTGKTSMIVGLAKVLQKKIGYTKPFGDRMLYRKKRLWDYDAALIANIFGFKELPDTISLGFDHSKLRYMYDESAISIKLREVLSDMGKDKDILFIEGGREINYGSSVHLDPLSIAACSGGKLIIVLSGNENAILDDLAFLRERIDLKGVNCGGVIMNKIPNLEEFKNNYLAEIKGYGFKILGMVPLRKELTTFTVGYLVERLFAKVVTGEDQFNKSIKNVFFGNMHVHAAIENPFFKGESKVVITSGSQTDMILAALESDTACVVITDNIFPAAKIISAAKEKSIPLLVVPADTLQIARQMEAIEPLLTKDDVDKIALLEQLVRDHIKWDEI